MLKEPPKAYAQMLKKEQDELVLSYMPALRAMAFRLKERLPSSIDVNDLISIGVEEMIKLSRRYDKEQNDNFWGFARKRVNGSMLDYLRSLDVMSRNNRKIIKDIDAIMDEYFLEHECEPDDEYLAKKLDLDVEKIKEVRAAHAISYTLPIDEQIELY
ncbi:sigma-70 family RNA polymerase sigma factor, partial [Campylobacter jejuni]|nr:sigma-70 family RNA polymerase sigma factor [Campylobacter jejuni]